MTSEEIKEYIVNHQGIVPTFKGPFGVEDSKRTVPRYFDMAYSVPVSNGGLRMTRHTMNGLGYFATIGSFLDNVGYQYGWNENNGNFGGYPQGAIVSKFDSTNNHLYEFVNTVENNRKEPVYDEDGVITEDTEVQNGWQPLNRMKEYSFFPDYEKRTLINESVVTSKLDRTFTISSPGWVLIEREIANWDDLSVTDLLIFHSALVYYLSNEEPDTGYSAYQDYIRLNEGPIASRFIPCDGTLNIRGEVSSPVTSMTIRIYLYEMEA